MEHSEIGKRTKEEERRLLWLQGQAEQRMLFHDAAFYAGILHLYDCTCCDVPAYGLYRFRYGTVTEIYRLIELYNTVSERQYFYPVNSSYTGICFIHSPFELCFVLFAGMAD